MNTLKKVQLAISALILAVLLAGLSLRPAPEPPVPAPSTFRLYEQFSGGQVSPAYLAYTQCTQVVDSMVTISWVRTEVLDTDQEHPIVEHELVHQEQMQRFSSCPAAYRWYRENRISAEAEAYCKSARVYRHENSRKVTLDGAIYLYARWLRNYGPGLTLGKAIEEIKVFCNG